MNQTKKNRDAQNTRAALSASSITPAVRTTWSLVDVDATRAQVFLRQLDLGHDLLVRLGHVVEGQHAPAETEEQVGAEGDEQPEGELFCGVAHPPYVSRQHALVGKRKGRGGKRAYNWDDLVLDDGRERDELEVETEVELQAQTLAWERLNAACISRRTELTRSAMEMVCCARVMVQGEQLVS